MHVPFSVHAQYHLFFTNVVPHMRLEPLACCDEYEVVKQVGAEGSTASPNLFRKEAAFL